MSCRKNRDRPDEILLAKALAAANARGLKGCVGARFRDKNHNRCGAEEAVFCCALGALEIAHVVGEIPGHSFAFVATGNDLPTVWGGARVDLGESLGWAFREAMS